jgi:hypothetical protein
MNGCVRGIGKIILRGKTEVLGERPPQLPQIPHGLNWARSRAFRLRSSAQYMANTYYLHCTVSDSLRFYRSVNQERMKIAGLDAKMGRQCTMKHVIALTTEGDKVFLKSCSIQCSTVTLN